MLSRDTTHASGGVITFVRQGLFFSELSTTSLSSLDPYSDYLRVNISLNNSSSLFLMFTLPLFALPSSTNLFILGDFNCHHPLWDSKDTSDPSGEKVFNRVISSDLSPSMTLTYLLFSITPLAVAPFLTSPLLSHLSPFLDHGRCFRTWVLIIHRFFYLSLCLRSFAPTSVLSSTFRKLAGMTLLLTFDSHCPSAEESTSFSLSSAPILFTSLALNADKSSISFGRIKRHPKAWWSAEMENAVSERRKAFAAAH